ncbi:MAG: hydroxymethylbilane synthase [Alphaproteobacteria bacterium]|jgi:hydroxymethylbilane synthase|nr:hydroxymethylbilane synthase [Alphaproteobacteria bacterium]MBO6627043.1 hydroxymethylbilane synthase [Alphaproteobacteria bacterium]MDF1626464.1 hydroxymethylbilane synthase [Parvibaculaceae bacterium]
MQRPIRIGTRGSALALVQANNVAQALIAAHGLDPALLEIVPIQTTGDREAERRLADIGGKGLFTKEIEDGLYDKTLDIAVHSMKDMPTVLPEGLIIDCVMEREDARDAFISPVAATLEALPKGAKFGTSSLRRAAQVLARRPDLEIVPFRGNVATRLKKLEDGVAAGTFLAMAGLNRLGMADVATDPMSPDIMLPAVAQGIVGIERRVDDEEMAHLLAPIHHVETAIVMAAERAFLAALDGSCRTPLAGFARFDKGRIKFQGQILTPDGKIVHLASREGSPALSAALGADAATELKAKGGPAFFATW